MMSARSAAALLLLHTAASHAPARAGDEADPYRWPLPSGRIVTSTFGEYRRDHFHAGIDISNGDAGPSPVLAARGGYVARVRVNPTGYGKILEIRHADGFTTAYAHLDRFSPLIEERVRREQRALERYPVDIACGPAEFPVAAGDLIGYTGRTGAASPHLHFEVRDRDGNPVNPFRWPSLRVKDTIPPVIRRIAVVPLEPDATVDGRRAPRTMRPGGKAREVVVTGKVGLAVEGRDRMPGSRFQNGLYARTLLVDGKAVFAERLDGTPWNETHEIELCYDHALPGGGRYGRLYINSPNHLGTYAPRLPGAGIIDAASLAPGPHALKIICADYAGNCATEDLTLVAGRSRVEPGPLRQQGVPPPMHVACAPDEEGVALRVSADGEFTAAPVVTVEEGDATTVVIMHRASAAAYEGHFTPRAEFQGVRRVTAVAVSAGHRGVASCAIDIRPVLPSRAGTIALDGGTLLLGYDSLSVLKPLYLSVSKESRDAGEVYAMAPEGVVLGSGFTVAIAPGTGQRHAGLFARTTGAWQYIGGSGALAPTKGRLRVRTGEVALLADSTPPALYALRSRGGEITVRFGDDRSGVEYDSLKMYIDGQLVIPEIDGRRHRAVFDARGAYARGPHQLTLRLTDRMGNSRTTVRRLVLR